MSTPSQVDAAVLALLRATILNVHDGHVTDSDESTKTISALLPYVVYYSTPGFPINARLGGTRGRAQEFQVSYVGKTREQAVWAGEKAEAALDRKRVTVGGLSRIVRRTDDNLYVRRDDTWTRTDGGPLFFGALRFVVARP